jgi:N-acetylglutamate synthase-like GNAT family acetyltransferase
MGTYITAIWGWDDAVQRDFHTREFNPDRWQIITADGTDIGILIVEYRPTEVYLARIELHPDLQGHGIGAHLILLLLDDADRLGQPLVLHVFANNRRAQAFFRRHGFRAVSQPGEKDYTTLMREVEKLELLRSLGLPADLSQARRRSSSPSGERERRSCIRLT